MESVRVGKTAWLALENNRGILIDAGMGCEGAGILKRIRKIGVQVPLIFLTHTHYDHAGSAEMLRNALSASVVVGEKEAEWLRNGYTPVPKGTDALGRFLSRAAQSGHQPEIREHYDPVSGDIMEAGEKDTLEAYGFSAVYIHLGGHSAGSMGLSIGDHFFAGDTVFGIGNPYPHFADLPDDIPAAWRKIIGSGAKYVCPGHGRMIKVDALKKEYTRRFGAI